jgi:hypothetical protein
MDCLILQPVVALMLWTVVVRVYMYVLCRRHLMANRIKPQSVATPELMNFVLPGRVSRPSNNFKNPFNLPVIFYALCLALVAPHQADAGF